MKKISKALSAVALSAALTLGAAGAAFAGVTYEDRDIAITGTGEYKADLFDSLKGVMPNGTYEQAVIVNNASDDDVKVYLSVDAHDESNPPVNTDEDIATMADFLAQLSMTITAGEKIVFVDTADQELANGVLLGELASGESLTIDASLAVPADLGNEYANRVGEVDWVFTVEEIDEPLPDTGLSQTGDNMPIMLLGGIAIAAVLIAVVALLATRRRNQEQ